MGRRKNNPELVEELIDGRWTMDQDEFEEKYESLSLDDKCRVGEAVNNMENEFLGGFSDEDDEERLSVYEAAEIWASYGKDEDYMFGYTEEELERALR